jgi:hypothetical protein
MSLPAPMTTMPLRWPARAEPWVSLGEPWVSSAGPGWRTIRLAVRVVVSETVGKAARSRLDQRYNPVRG